jgi:SAM-dependent methyltransferase
MMKSPLIEGAEAQLEKSLPSEKIISLYKKKLDVDVRPYFKGIDAVQLYRCKKSDYLFYFPLHTSGKSEFYETLQNFEWYYMPWKWEHQKCNDFLKDGQRILEVGCGRGDFLKSIVRQHEVECVGLELNQSAVFESDNLKIINQSIEDYSQNHKEQFDIVCSFQVLEHISKVKSFIEGNIRCLKRNGLLVICVPNNDSYISLDQENMLNMPPHHMGLWNETSLRKLGEHFDLEAFDVLFEPLQPYHFDYYTSLYFSKGFGNNSLLNRVISKLLHLGGKKITNLYLKKRANKIKGHSIMGLYRKK